MATACERYAAECCGTALLLAVVVGSGIMGERLSGGNPGIALLANSLATVGGLFLLIELFGPISGAHLNPAVSLALWIRGVLPAAELPGYCIAQGTGAVGGTWLAHGMFGLPVLELSTTLRPGAGLLLGEFIATAGLIGLVLHAPPAKAPVWISLFIGTAYWFTSSTSFANPAAVLGRSLSNTFSGIAPASAPAFVIAEFAAAAAIAAGARKLAGAHRTASAPGT